MKKLVFDNKIYYQMFYQLFHEKANLVYSQDLSEKGDIVFTSIWKYSEQSKIRKLIEKCERNNCKIILLDIEGEDWEYSAKISNIINIVRGNDSVYFLSSRFWYNGKENKTSQRNYYLNLFYYYYLMNDGLMIHPQIPNGNFTNNTYDFISYLGLQNNDTDYHIDDKMWREREINSINFGDSTIYLPTSYKHLVPKHIRDLHRSEIFDGKDWGQWNWYSILESQKAKIKIVFETHHFNNDTQGCYFTEKTMKCLIYNQPYILFLPPHLRHELSHHGFRLPYNDEHIPDYISKYIRPNPSAWVERNQQLYDYNKNHFYTLLNSKHLPHYKFVNDVINTNFKIVQNLL